MTNETVDCQEILFAEREGARIARDLIEAGNRLVTVLRPAIQKNHEVVVALLTGYVGVLIDDMPGFDPVALLKQVLVQLHAGDPGSEALTANLMSRVVQRLDERRSRVDALKRSDDPS
jgi:hypothetical protein